MNKRGTVTTLSASAIKKEKEKKRDLVVSCDLSQFCVCDGWSGVLRDLFTHFTSIQFTCNNSCLLFLVVTPHVYEILKFEIHNSSLQ